jgi:GTP cyclohydrolase I
VGYELWTGTEQEAAAYDLLSSLEAWGRSPKDHRAETPRRFVQALKQLTEREEFNFTTFPATSDEMVTLGPIPFYTLCAHHVVPFYGNAWVSYVPQEKLAGLSKFARAVKYVAKGFWVQEELTDAIARYLQANLQPAGLGVVIKAEHLCMAMRGVQTPGVITTTAVMRGVYADHSKTAKQEFLGWIS